MGQAKRKQEAARRLVESVDLSIFQTPEVRAAVREHMVRRGLTDQVSKAERGGDSGNSAEPMNRVRESARDADATGDGDGLIPIAVPGTVRAQAGDRSQSSAIGSASPSNALGKSGASAEPGASRPAAAPADQPAALAPDELCDIDDLPDCLVGGVHQPHCRHAGKPVTKGGNP